MTDRPVGDRARRAAKYFADNVKPSSAGAEGRLAELASLLSGDASSFERGLERLGLLLGFDARRPSGEAAAPDGVWISDGEARIIFEAKTDERADAPVSARDVRQASTHRRWVERQLGVTCSPGVPTALVCSKDDIDAAAEAVADPAVALVDPSAIVELGRRTVSALRRVRAVSRGQSQVGIAQRVANEFSRADLETQAVLRRLGGRRIGR